jgi:glyoxylase-like metal-dependent hydrolase (beta-lactamase superfamily II)
LHPDHCGGNAALKTRFGDTQISIAANSVDAVSRWDQTVLDHESFGQPCERFAANHGIEVGQSLRLGDLDWRVIGSPGHDADSFVLHNEAHRILISADALWENGFGVLFPELRGRSAFAEQRASLAAIEALDVAVVIPGHGPMFTDVPGALERANRRLDAQQADPRRHARYAIRVMIKFLLLERRRLHIDDVANAIQNTPVLIETKHRFLPETTEQVAKECVESLLNSNAARRDGQWLLN